MLGELAVLTVLNVRVSIVRTYWSGIIGRWVRSQIRCWTDRSGRSDGIGRLCCAHRSYVIRIRPVLICTRWCSYSAKLPASDLFLHLLELRFLTYNIAWRLRSRWGRLMLHLIARISRWLLALRDIRRDRSVSCLINLWHWPVQRILRAPQASLGMQRTSEINC